MLSGAKHLLFEFRQTEIEDLCLPRVVTKMLAGLMSRWVMPFACAASSPSAT
jgi:hypothetical protein